MRREGPARASAEHPAGGRAVAGSNPVSPIHEGRQMLAFFVSEARFEWGAGVQLGHKFSRTFGGQGLERDLESRERASLRGRAVEGTPRAHDGASRGRL